MHLWVLGTFYDQSDSLLFQICVWVGLSAVYVPFPQPGSPIQKVLLCPLCVSTMLGSGWAKQTCPCVYGARVQGSTAIKQMITELRIPCLCYKCILEISRPAFPQSTRIHLVGWKCSGERQILRFCGSLDTGSELMLICGNNTPVLHQNEDSRWSNNKWGSSPSPTVGSRSHFADIFPAPDSNWNTTQSAPGRAAYWVPHAYVKGSDKWKVLELFLGQETTATTKCHASGWIADINVIIQDLKAAEVVLI